MTWWVDYDPTQDDLDNHSDQLNPNNDKYQGDDEDQKNKTTSIK